MSPSTITELKLQTEEMARALGVVGLMNVQFAIQDDQVFVLEVNPRASRTVPFVAKATGVPVAKIGARVMAGARLSEFKLDDEEYIVLSEKDILALIESSGGEEHGKTDRLQR